jgi:hypothetical protein
LKNYKAMDRRNFFRKSGRLLLLGGMAGAAAYLVANGQVQKTGTCGISDRCGGCKKLASCGFEQATEYLSNGEK